jgi:hypothetical protein
MPEQAEVRQQILTLEQHAERANALVWRSASDEDKLAWIREAEQAMAEGHSQRAVARAFGVDQSTMSRRITWAASLQVEEPQGDAPALDPSRIRDARSSIARAPAEVVNALTPEQRDGLLAELVTVAEQNAETAERHPAPKDSVDPHITPEDRADAIARQLHDEARERLGELPPGAPLTDAQIAAGAASRLAEHVVGIARAARELATANLADNRPAIEQLAERLQDVVDELRRVLDGGDFDAQVIQLFEEDR